MILSFDSGDICASGGASLKCMTMSTLAPSALV
jgi:hypothetical protein